MMNPLTEDVDMPTGVDESLDLAAGDQDHDDAAAGQLASLQTGLSSDVCERA